MGPNLTLVIAALFALTNGGNVPPKGGKNRLAGWNNLANKCDFVRRHIKTYGYCWKDENEAKGIDTQKERHWVKEVIQQWEKCGGIKFVEEPTCRQGPDFVTINVGNYHPIVIPHYEKKNECKIYGFKMYLDFYTFGEGFEDYRKTEKVAESFIKMYSLHEFGHFLGFDHEHNRNDKYDCDEPIDDPMVGPKAIWGTYNITEAYDPNSIMNYCTKNVHYKPYLSELDKKAVRATFGGGNQQECDAVTKPWKWGPGEGLDNYTLKQLDMDLKGISCYDLSEDDYCARVKGSCDESTRNYYCRKSCGTCSTSGGQVTNTNILPNPTTVAPACVDRESPERCADLKEYCGNEGVPLWCAKTCGVCK